MSSSATRAFVFTHEKALKPHVVLECESCSDQKATVPAHIKLTSVKVGQIFCKGVGRQPDRSTDRKITSVDQKKSGTSTIAFQAPTPAPVKDKKV